MTAETWRVSSGAVWADALRARLGGLWERMLRLSRRTPKRLRLCESLALGERRFVAVVEFEKARFLVGGTATSLVLLSRLADGQNAEGQNTENQNGESRNEANERRRGEAC